MRVVICILCLLFSTHFTFAQKAYDDPIETFYQGTFHSELLQLFEKNEPQYILSVISSYKTKIGDFGAQGQLFENYINVLSDTKNSEDACKFINDVKYEYPYYMEHLHDAVELKFPTLTLSDYTAISTGELSGFLFSPNIQELTKAEKDIISILGLINLDIRFYTNLAQAINHTCEDRYRRYLKIKGLDTINFIERIHEENAQKNDYNRLAYYHSSVMTSYLMQNIHQFDAAINFSPQKKNQSNSRKLIHAWLNQFCEYFEDTDNSCNHVTIQQKLKSHFGENHKSYYDFILEHPDATYEFLKQQNRVSGSLFKNNYPERYGEIITKLFPNIEGLHLSNFSQHKTHFFQHENKYYQLNKFPSTVSILSFRNIDGLDVALQDWGGKSVYINHSEFETIDFQNSTLSGELHLVGSSGGLVNLNGLSAKKLNVSNNPHIKDLDLWYTNIEVVNISGDVTELTKKQKKLFKKPSVIDEINASFMRVSKRILFRNVKSEHVDFASLVTGEFYANCIEIDKWLKLQSGNIREYGVLQNIKVPRLDLYALKSSNVHLGGSTGNFETDYKKISACPENSDLDNLSMYNANIDNFSISNTNLSHNAWLTNSQMRTLAFGEGMQLDKNASLFLRGAKIDKLYLKQGIFSEIHNDESSPKLDTQAANIKTINIYDPFYDGSFFGHQIHRYNSISEEQLKPFSLDETEYKHFLIDEIIPAVSVEDKNNIRNYNGEIYYTLRNSAKLVGYPEIEKDIAIIQNIHYGNIADSLGTRFIYKLGYYINSFGHNNLKAVLWLCLLLMLGVVVVNMEYFSWLYGKVYSKIINKEDTKVEAKLPKPTFRLWDSVFFSLDRTLPSLTLDTDFSQPITQFKDGNHQSHIRFKMGFFYIQRLLAFVVIIFIFGGVFNTFQ